jgi:hydrogenase expression/formation protein HypD
MNALPFEQFRDPEKLDSIRSHLCEFSPDRELKFMHVCGTHENAIAKFGLRTLLPDWLTIIAGPGCPVCVCPSSDIDVAARLALEKGAIVATFGDMIRVPGKISLSQARAQGGDIRVVFSAADAIEIAKAEPDRQVVLLAIGFETTACTVAAAVLSKPPDNFSILATHRLVPPALEALLQMDELAIDGFLLPGHVLTVAGTGDYQRLATDSQMASVVAGFEPVDIMLGLDRLCDMTVSNSPDVVNVYQRAVRESGNPKALEAMDRAFDVVDAPWRGIGTIPKSGMVLSREFEDMNALARFDIAPDETLAENPAGCLCSKVMVGINDPIECKMFATACTPDNPRGPCMVSAEGTCRSRYLYREA